MRLIEDDVGIAVTDEAGTVLARVGEKVRLGGGEGSSDFEDIPSPCRNLTPWIVGSVNGFEP